MTSTPPTTTDDANQGETSTAGQKRTIAVTYNTTKDPYSTLDTTSSDVDITGKMEN